MADSLIYFDIPKDGTTVSSTNTDFQILENENVVLESVKNILGLQKGSLIFKNKHRGASLDKFLFAPIDSNTAYDMYEEIDVAITTQESRAKNLSIEITPLPDDNTMRIDIRFSVDESDREIEFQTTLEKLR